MIIDLTMVPRLNISSAPSLIKVVDITIAVDQVIDKNVVDLLTSKLH